MRHQSFVDHDRRHAFGDGHEPPQHLIALDDVEDLRGACTLGQQEFARLDRGARAEHPRAQFEESGGRNRALPLQLGRDRAEARAIGDEKRGILAERTRCVPAAAEPAERCAERKNCQQDRQAAPAGEHQSSTALTITEALVPPNPKLLLSAALTLRFLATCGTRSTPSVPSSGLSRLSVGGTI